MKISVLDTETLKLDPKNPREVMVDEIGVAVFEGEESLVSIAGLAETMRYWFDNLAKGNVVQNVPGRSTAGFCFNAQLVKLPIIEQVLMFRSASQDTVDWHKKKGYELEKETRDLTVDRAMAYLKKLIADSDVVLCRGQDFDFPLINSFLPEDDTICNHRKERDIRTALDSLLMDGKYGLQTDERLDAAPLFKLSPVGAEALVLAKEINVLRVNYGHRGSNDAAIDLLMLMLFRHTQAVLVNQPVAKPAMIEVAG